MNPRRSARKQPAKPRAVSRREVGWFLAKVAGWLLLSYGLSFLPGAGHLGDQYLEAVATLATALVRACGLAATVDGVVISSPGWVVTVTPECSASELLFLAAAVVLAFPAGWRARLAGVAIFAASLAVVNVLRVATLQIVGVQVPAWFRLLHEQVWPMALVVAVGLILLLWINAVSFPRVAAPDEAAA